MHSDEEHDPFITVFVAIIFLFFIYVTLYSLYDLCCLRRSRSNHIRSSRSLSPAMVFVPIDPSHIPSRGGLDPAVVKSLPVFTFSGAAEDPIDCAVCLSEFEEGESGRVLPGCEHAFHVECIDMWFHSHSTCPLCRSLVEPLVDQTVIAISPEPVSETEPAVEMSRRSFRELEDGFLTGDSLANHHSLPLPPRSRRMLSFTRMLSRDRRSAPSSFAGAPHQSSPSCGIVMNELDIERGGEEIKSDFRHVEFS
ncbi:RING-H2 finger protein ATL2-like [Raphanus sativus]|uniref:RING-type E3 ubiquitin transferase n=1 Tax=Raphanus sativus TaxID=3726 RepID=A0A9W3C231_RAPSA|nr:RING-H2 finger protein ATL2-like [Raphanus sativus]